ncbi:MAG: hypothetical protein A2252_04685 [Elusimicrobia bacterium RIFOXYA2_FULL_39_19]|nr:MAG: hypothetical protein A2252_04685 [Elusimicrobia bacterium RIFOXYA2_FULL_39_19]
MVMNNQVPPSHPVNPAHAVPGAHPQGHPVVRHHSGNGKTFAIAFTTSLITAVIVTILTYLYIIPILFTKQTAEVPNVCESKLEHSKLMLETKGLTFEVTGEENHPTIPEGYVVKQDPGAGIQIKKGSAVKLTISKGKAMTFVPDVIKMTLEEAKIEISKANLVIDRENRIQSPSIPANSIISIEPQQGTTVDLGSKVNLIISNGPPKVVKKVVIPMVTVPKLIDTYFDDVQKTLEKSGLKLGKISKSYSDDKDFDVILLQFPAAGTKTKKGSEVSVTVNSELEAPAQQAAPEATEPAAEPVPEETPAQ